MTDILYNEDNIRVVRLSCTTLGGKIEPIEGASENYYDLTLFPPRHRYSMTYVHIDFILKRLQNIHAEIERSMSQELDRPLTDAEREMIVPGE